ncbi:hypothetical protein [Arthrobacter mobilis]|uniref:Uncharacterized protein n=1 Tax=Arthrobacter mobilis TaxID=2724944 RepID=A0A7X6HGX8_9MICC|nr:hypothetical protein [Arthrobacter mobilis]NKX56175.1 hypothetical protein [Arthrobacter mobilis]
MSDRRPRFEIVDEPDGRASILDHAARVAYPFLDRSTAEEVLAKLTPVEIIRRYHPSASHYRTLTRET